MVFESLGRIASNEVSNAAVSRVRVQDGPVEDSDQALLDVIVSIYCARHTARTKAGLADVRMHDLRHSFASLLINSGRTLYEVQHILGHTQVKTTQRYAHLSQDTLLAASNGATVAMGSVMGTMPNRVVDVPLVAALG
jgi:hypothetical protein